MKKYLLFLILLIPLILLISKIIKYYRNNKQLKLAKKLIEKRKKVTIKPIEGNKFSKNIMQTYRNKEGVPIEIINNIKDRNKDWNYYFYDDNDIKEFMLKYYGQDFVDKFNSYSYGAHKADLFRLCWLYQIGGVYIDIDMELLKPLDEIIEENNGFLLGMSEDNFSKRLFNAFMVAEKGNKKVKECIENIMKLDNKELKNNYLLILYTMQETLGKDFNYKFTEKNVSVTYTDIKGTWRLFDDKKAIANSTYSNYKNGGFII